VQYCSRNVSCALNEISAVLLIILDFFLQPFHCTIEAIILVIHFVMIKVVLYAYHLCQDIQLPICLTLILSSMSRYTIYLFVWLWSCHLCQDMQLPICLTLILSSMSRYIIYLFVWLWSCHLFQDIQFTYLSDFDLVIYFKIYNLPICLTLILSSISRYTIYLFVLLW
jgi:hypothetical protein